MSELQLEVGKSYRTRAGGKAYVFEWDADCGFPFNVRFSAFGVISEFTSWCTADGHFYRNTPAHENDLVAEWTDPPSESSPPDTITFATGAVRSADRARQRYDLISPIGLRRLAETCHEGATKYTAYNWEAGMPISEMLRHAIPHIYAYLSGDRSEDHLAHAAWNLFGAMHSEELWPHLNTDLRSEGCVPPVEKPVVTA